MKNRKTYVIIFLISFIIFLLLLLLLTSKIILENRKISDELPTYYSHAVYLHDTSTPENAIGVAHYAFIAKINGIERTEYRDPLEIELVEDGSKTKKIYDPYTIYNITVIENIKGNLVTDTNIELEQMGGLNKDKDSYYFPQGTGLLNIGEYYILLAYAPFDDGNLQINSSTSIISLGKISNESSFKYIENVVSSNNIDKISDLQNALQNKEVESESINKVLEYKKALLNSIVPENKTNNKSKYDIYYIHK